MRLQINLLYIVIYLNFGVSTTGHSFDAVSTIAHEGSDLKVFLPWVSKTETAMGWFPSREVGLHAKYN